MKIRYTHPHYPHTKRTGTIQSSGPDGHCVINDTTGLEENVRHHDVISVDDNLNDTTIVKSVAYPLMLGGTDDAFRNLAAPYADQYEAGHPAALNVDDLDWNFDPFFSLDNLPGTRAEWCEWAAANNRNLGYIYNPTPVVIVQGTDGHHYVWDGNHRIGEANLAAWEHAPAIVGRSRIREDQPADWAPPGSAGRSEVRKSLRPLVLSRHWNRQDRALSLVRLRASAHLAEMTLLKAMPQAGLPTHQPQIPQRPQAATKPGQPAQGNPGEWPMMAGHPYKMHDAVQYQRPDMHSPAVGYLANHGSRHGAYVTQHDTGATHEVRWEHIHGPAQVGVSAQERPDAAAILMDKMGVPIDPKERALLADRAERPNPHLVARAKVLMDDGAPIDPKALTTLNAAQLRMVIEHFAGPMPHEEGSRPQRELVRPKEKLTPWSD